MHLLPTAKTIARKRCSRTEAFGSALAAGCDAKLLKRLCRFFFRAAGDDDRRATAFSGGHYNDHWAVNERKRETFQLTADFVYWADSQIDAVLAARHGSKINDRLRKATDEGNHLRCFDGALDRRHTGAIRRDRADG